MQRFTENSVKKHAAAHKLNQLNDARPPEFLRSPLLEAMLSLQWKLTSMTCCGNLLHQKCSQFESTSEEWLLYTMYTILHQICGYSKFSELVLVLLICIPLSCSMVRFSNCFLTDRFEVLSCRRASQNRMETNVTKQIMSKG